MKNRTAQKISMIGIFGSLIMASHLTLASTTRVGNGDDGKDLEGIAKIQSGPIWDARLIAVERMKNLNVPGVAGLGYLIPEVQTSELLMVQKDVAPLQHETGSEVSADQKLVYARTFAEPHAATRFFPSALKLDQEQLVALHIHEGLHRSLPEEYREDEDLVSAITLAITTPGANFDRIRRVSSVWMNKTASPVAMPVASESTMSVSAEKVETKFDYRKDQFQYTYLFFATRTNSVQHSSDLHVFGVEKTFFKSSSYQPTVGFRMSANSSYRGGEKLKMGPSEISGQMHLLNQEGFQLTGFASNTFGSGSSWDFSRDVLTVGLKTRYEGFDFLFETSARYSPGSLAKKTECYYQECERKFSDIWSLGMRSGYKGTSWHLLGAADFHTSNGWQNQNNEKSYVMDPYGDEDWSGSSLKSFSLLAVGPEIRWKFSSGLISLFGKEVVASSTQAQERSMTDLGDMMGRGFASRFVGMNLLFEL